MPRLAEDVIRQPTHSEKPVGLIATGHGHVSAAIDSDWWSLVRNRNGPPAPSIEPVRTSVSRRLIRTELVWR